jgi:hypothetical protein
MHHLLAPAGLYWFLSVSSAAFASQHGAMLTPGEPSVILAGPCWNLWNPCKTFVGSLWGSCGKELGFGKSLERVENHCVFTVFSMILRLLERVGFGKSWAAKIPQGSHKFPASFQQEPTRICKDPSRLKRTQRVDQQGDVVRGAPPSLINVRVGGWNSRKWHSLTSLELHQTSLGGTLSLAIPIGEYKWTTGRVCFSLVSWLFLFFLRICHSQCFHGVPMDLPRIAFCAIIFVATMGRRSRSEQCSAPCASS